MDLDVFVARHREEWARLEQLLRKAHRRRALSGGEADELVLLYQRVATHLSLVQSRAPDPALVGRLSSLVARARAAVVGGSAPAWREVAAFVQVAFPVTVYRAWRWCAAAAVGSLLVAALLGAYIAADPQVQAALLPPQEVQQLVTKDFEAYYSSNPAGSFAARVWTNNVLVAATSLLFGVLLGLPTIYILLRNAANLGVAGGFLAANGQTGKFFGLILPHGLLELTAVFVAAGVGLRLGWTVIDPGRRRRADALAAEGRAAVTVALGLVAVLGVSGVIEAFVTPSPLPTWARIGLGIVAEVVFLGYLVVFGRRGVRAGLTGDLDVGLRSDEAPVS